MPTPSFSAKLDALPATIDLLRDFDAGPLSAGLRAGIGRHAVSVGSGGSAISAEYLARCRDTLGLGPTTVQTPMQTVLDSHDLSGSDVWLFSAGADNPDVVAAAQAAVDRRAGSLRIVTRNPEGAAVKTALAGGGTACIVPVADAKDGYLATHSLLSTVCALLLASDSPCEPRGRRALLDGLLSWVLAMRDAVNRAGLRETVGGLAMHHTVIVANDPLLRPAAVLLDTSLWEASLCNVQTTDLRNLAHGRHAWLHHRAGETLVLAVTSAESRKIWSAIESVLPDPPRRLVLDRGAGGRLDNAFAIIDCLGIVEAIGDVLGVDPGKPGIGEFGRSIYGDRSLEALAATMPSRLRHKRAAAARLDSGDRGGPPLHEIWRDRLSMLAAADIGGAVFDYDGTLVTAEGRWEPPRQAIIDELVRLQGLGLRIGVATGRGGSAGEDLRKVLPPDFLRSILVGYYNGGCILPADVDLREQPPSPHPAIAETAEWLGGRSDLFLESKFKASGVQITVDMDRLRHGYRFPVDLADCPPVAAGVVRVAASGHSFDIVPATSSKLAVVDAIQDLIGEGKAVLRFGDSGSRTGNDNALLSHPLGISVGEVCGEPDGCWSLFGPEAVGPEALLKILRSLVSSQDGGIRLDVASLGLNNSPKTST